MLFRSFASFLLLASGAFAVLVVLLFAASVGAFGPDARVVVYGLIDSLEKFYAHHKGPVDYTVWVLSLGISAVTGTFAIYKSWYYAEFSLPRRLTSLIDRRSALLWSARPALLAAANDAASDYQRSAPVFYFYPIHKLLRDLGFGGPRYLASELTEAIDENARDLGAVRSRVEELENEIVTGHILKGSLLAAEATLVSRHSPDRVAKNHQALAEFKAALELNKDDVDALMLAARQSEILGDDGSALNYANRMIIAAALQDMSIRHAQAHRLCAEIQFKSNWDAARGKITDGIAILDDLVETSLDKSVELTKSLILLGEIQTRRERYTAATRALSRAKGLLTKLDKANREKLSKDLDDKFDDLDAAQQDKEEPGD